MVNRALADVAKSLLEAVRTKTIEPDHPYTLAHLAEVIKVSPKSLKKLVDVWETLEQTMLRLKSSDNQQQGARRRYYLTFTASSP